MWASSQQAPVGLTHPPSGPINTLPSMVKEKAHSPKVMPFLDKKMSHIHHFCLQSYMVWRQEINPHQFQPSRRQMEKASLAAGETVALSARRVAMQMITNRVNNQATGTTKDFYWLYYPACTPPTVHSPCRGVNQQSSSSLAHNPTSQHLVNHVLSLIFDLGLRDTGVGTAGADSSC